MRSFIPDDLSLYRALGVGYMHGMTNCAPHGNGSPLFFEENPDDVVHNMLLKWVFVIIKFEQNHLGLAGRSFLHCVKHAAEILTKHRLYPDKYVDLTRFRTLISPDISFALRPPKFKHHVKLMKRFAVFTSLLYSLMVFSCTHQNRSQTVS